MIRALILAALIGAAAALWTWTRPGMAETGAPRDAVVVQVLDNGFHTDLAVPRAALMRRGGPLAQAAAGLGPGDWILIGWGDARFYVDQSPISDRLPDGARAFFRPGNASVVMLDPAAVDPRLSHGEDSARLTLTQAQFDRLAARVERSLALSHGAARIVAARPGDDARFFASRETFSILHLCNHWTAQVLNAAGVAIRPVRSITSVEVMRAARASEGARKLDMRPGQD
ncbi:hypothetical protein SH203_02824 [Brevundimonas sp. SH203]|uniref:DUF2459 domain-containing protein n=1 Tax=Brevundimonas sp. SH203 TaxID=345167 RepID=UPI0009D07D5F|nr:DUF2459 domain-containing protein [Brevundimonas sp. SH203]GAW42408.1 hypothetical protein SH203_02824 [Brevundimonas sp. SH203]